MPDTDGSGNGTRNNGVGMRPLTSFPDHSAIMQEILLHGGDVASPLTCITIKIMVKC